MQVKGENIIKSFIINVEAATLYPGEAGLAWAGKESNDSELSFCVEVFLPEVTNVNGWAAHLELIFGSAI